MDELPEPSMLAARWRWERTAVRACLPDLYPHCRIGGEGSGGTIPKQRVAAASSGADSQRRTTGARYHLTHITSKSVCTFRLGTDHARRKLEGPEQYRVAVGFVLLMRSH